MANFVSERHRTKALSEDFQAFLRYPNAYSLLDPSGQRNLVDTHNFLCDALAAIQSLLSQATEQEVS